MKSKKSIRQTSPNNDHLSRLTKNAIDHNEAVVVKTIIDTIAAFGRDGINPITEILNHSNDESVKLHALDAVKVISSLMLIPER